MCVRSSTGDILEELLATCIVFLDIVISVEDCFEIRLGMKALFPASGFRHGVIDITGKDDFLPFLVNLKHSKAARLGAARVHDAAARLQIPC